jgi:hypothetical protein
MLQSELKYLTLLYNMNTIFGEAHYHMKNVFVLKEIYGTKPMKTKCICNKVGSLNNLYSYPN